MLLWDRSGEASAFTDVDNGDTTWRAATLALSFFFFQAEDGIRDLTVTGVQTCALPISLLQDQGRHPRPALPREDGRVGGPRAEGGRRRARPPREDPQDRRPPLPGHPGDRKSVV